MDTFQDIFSTPLPQRTPQPGDIIVVEPFLREVHFRRAVVLLIDHNEQEGSVGLVLNKRSNVKLNEVLRNATCRRDIPLHIGGPVEHGRLLYLHTLGNRLRDAVALENGLYIGGNFNDVLQYIDSDEYDERCIKFFAGYSGWTAGQLAREIAERTWAIAPLPDTLQAMLAHDSDYWRDTVAQLGDEYRSWLLCPSEPNLN